MFSKNCGVCYLEIIVILGENGVFSFFVILVLCMYFYIINVVVNIERGLVERIVIFEFYVKIFLYL